MVAPVHMQSVQWRWVAADGSEQTGDTEALRDALRSGRAAWSTSVWRAGLPGWQPASTLPELAEGAFVVEDDAPTVKDNPIPEAPPGAEEPWAQAPAPQPAQPVQLATAAPRPAPQKKSGGWITTLLGALGGAVVLGAVAGLGAYAKHAADKIPEAPASALASASGEAPSAAPDAGPGCRAAPAKRLAKPVLGRVPLEITEAGEGKIAIGFAESKNKARALLLSVADLAELSSKSADSEAPISGAVAALAGGELKLEVDEDTDELRAAKTVLGDKPFTLGATREGIVKKDTAGQAEVVWRDAEGELTVPRVETLAGAGHLVVFRRGGLGGRVQAGWLELDGAKKTPLSSPVAAANALGTPAAAVSERGVIVLAAGRKDTAAPWQIFAGHSGPGSVPESLSPLDLGDAAQSRISPTAARAADGRWLLQWTEGGEGSHFVRVMQLDEELAPIGEPTTVSPATADAGQGQIASVGPVAVSLFLVSSEGTHELWGSTVKCH